MLELLRSIALRGSLLALLLPACGSSAPGNDASVGGGGQPTAGAPEQPSGGAGGAGGSNVVPPAGGVAGQVTTTGGSGGQGGSPAVVCNPPTLSCNSSLPLPATIKETGFFPAAPDLSTVAPTLSPFQPSLELWSSGLGKKRLILLPPGKQIDIQDREHWVSPVGTIFVKTFLADGPGGENTRPIETRIIRRTSDPDPLNEYEFAVYRWNEAGTDATLLEPFWPAVDVPLSAAGNQFTHVIPARSDCDRCHGANATKVIGFDELRLNWQPPGAATTLLQAFAARGAFASALPDKPAQISVPTDPQLEKIEGFVQGNCVHCHNGLDSSVFDLRYPTFVQNTVGQMTMGSGTSEGLRVEPGKPDSSILYRQVARTMLPEGLNPMPPVGVELAPKAALGLLRQWILALPQQ